MLENYELGFKSQWLDNRLLVNVSLFFMEWYGHPAARRP